MCRPQREEIERYSPRGQAGARGFDQRARSIGGSAFGRGQQREGDVEGLTRPDPSAARRRLWRKDVGAGRVGFRFFGPDDRGISFNDLGFGRGFRRILRIYPATVEKPFRERGDDDFVDVDIARLIKTQEREMKKMNEWLKSRRGQNTVEYLLMLTVVVGVVLAAGFALKKYMPGLFQQIQGMISGAASNLGQ